MPFEQKNIGKEAALQKARQFCAYQERCHAETRDKLYTYGLYPYEVEELLAQLVSEDYLNEERFAKQFAGGKFRVRQWGKQKIRYALKQQQVSDYCIRQALATIDEDEYQQTLEKLFEKKRALLKAEKNIFVRKRKLQDYLLQKGYESGDIAPLLRTLDK